MLGNVTKAPSHIKYLLNVKALISRELHRNILQYVIVEVCTVFTIVVTKCIDLFNVKNLLSVKKVMAIHKNFNTH